MNENETLEVTEVTNTPESIEETGEDLSGEVDGAVGRNFQKVQRTEEGRLARAGRTDDGDLFGEIAVDFLAVN